MYNWKLTILLFTVILAGCVSNSPPPELPKTKELPISHVNWPAPINPCSSSLKVETRNFDLGEDGAVVVIPYKDYLNIQNCNAAKAKFTSGLVGMVCFYRQDLAEKRCEFYYPTIKD